MVDENKAPAVVAAKAEAIKVATVEKKAVRRQLYSNDNWKMRRRVIYLSLLFIATVISYVVIFADKDDSLRGNLAIALVGAGVSIVGSYAFAAVWDDNSKRAMLAANDTPTSPPEE